MPVSASSARPTFGLATAVALLVTNMVGTGVFTCLGFQLAGLDSPFAILLLWGLGGVIALCGATVYAELGLAFPGSGGECRYLAGIYHPAAGFLAGWISATVGFAAPIALSAMALGRYAARVWPGLPPTGVACLAILGLALVHGRGLRGGSALQRVLTWAAVLLIVCTAAAGLFHHPPQPLVWRPSTQVFTPSFAVSLVFVCYAYTGWNAVAYVAGELRDPGRTLPRTLLLGTTLVTGLYLALNLAFLRSAPTQEMRGVVEVAHVAARHIFGEGGARLMSLVLCTALLGSVSGMLFTGARIPQVLAQAHGFLPSLARRNAAGAPVGGLALQAGLALAMVLTGTFEGVLALVSFTLALCTGLTVAGIFVVRTRRGAPATGYRCWGYPFTPGLFLLLNVWMLAYTFVQQPLPSSLGLLLVGTGFPVYRWLQRSSSRPAFPPAGVSAAPLSWRQP